MRTLLSASLAVLVACGSCAHHSDRYTRKQAQKSLGKLEQPGLVIGEFKFGRVVDGDTVHVDGLDSSLRLLGFDTEETFKHETERREFDKGWAVYKKEVRGSSPRPVKFATPMGDAARDWAVEWFANVDKVRLERDHPAEIRDRYNRYLAYVFANKNGQWLNYNVEAVRAGWAPYFPKYGNSRRFHKDFLAAEAEAKAAHRGIWAANVMAYDDYPEREAWWSARGDFVAQFRSEAEGANGKPNMIDLTHWDAMNTLESYVGKEVVILATVGEVIIGEKGPTRVMLSRAQKSDFPLVFFDKDVFGTSGIGAWKGEWVRVTGVPSIYENKHTHKKQLQIQIERASQITLSQVPGLTKPTVPTEVPATSPTADTPD
ncbi:MAG TPA: thermonuclease family protein [Kofleriaceae bacterium]